VDLIITPATAEDLALCAEWMALNDPWLTLGIEDARCLSALQRPGTELFVAREVDGQATVGFIQLAAQGLAGSPYIASIGVAAEARGNGIGSELLDFAEEYYAGKRHIFLLVSSFNERAQGLYRRHGYLQVGEIPDYIVQGYSELILVKRITTN
jgi:ribosomal protein S18 acetylase RimI-like enzyme